MSDLLSTPINQVTEDDLKDVTEIKKVREHISLDYKLTSYKHSHSGAVDLLADVTAMANSRGGLIIIGVEEDRDAPDGTPKEVKGIANGDAEANWIQSVCLSSIDERIPGLRVRDIPLSNGQHCVLIQIPNSPKKPHMIVHENHRSFRVRHDRANAFIGVQEIKSMIMDMVSYQTNMTHFLEERVQSNLAIADGMPFTLLMATPIYIGSDKIDPLDKGYRYW